MANLLQSFLFVGKGMGVTLQILSGGLCMGVVIGACAAALRHQNMFACVINRFVSIIRGTPLLLQLAFVYFVLPGFLPVKLSVVAAGIFTFGLNSSAYIAEILRAGIESIPKGQFEAAQTLKIPVYYMWKDIIFPQVLKNILPSMVGEVIALLKETALIATIGGMDIMRSAQVLAAQEFTYFTPLCIAGVYYYGCVLLIEYVGKRLEQRFSVC